LRYPLLVAFGALAIGLLAWAVFLRLPPPGARFAPEGLAHVGLALLLGGALGNYLDRVGRGYVVDFIHAAHWPVFNVADVWVTLGGLALVLVALKRARPSTP
jgi:signal peptidase II